MAKTWLLVANGSEARLFEMDERRAHLELLKEYLHPPSRLKERTLTSDRPGRFESGHMGTGTAHGAYAEPSDPKQFEMERFAEELTNELEHARTANRFTDVILAAPPHFHGLLNQRLSVPLQRMVLRHIEKDYTNVRQLDLLDQLRPHME